ncbi:MAG: DMT family protein [Elusimicrobia bacterium]|nr:DMT family protein [Elusimicrobiota bacterium]
MTVAWYGHLRHKSYPLWAAIFASWLIALPEYALQVPANRWGHGAFSAPQLKVIQEAVSIAVFMVFCAAYLREPIRWNHLGAFLLIVAAAFLAVWGRPGLAPASARGAAALVPAAR